MARPETSVAGSTSTLLPQRYDDQHQAQRNDDHGRSFPWLTALGFFFLTFNSAMAVYRSNGDMGAIAFVVFSYTDLVALFFCLRMYESISPESLGRERLKMAVWVLTTMLTAAFSYKVAAVMPMAVATLLWAMAASTGHASFVVFFLYKEDKSSITPSSTQLV